MNRRGRKRPKSRKSGNREENKRMLREMNNAERAKILVEALPYIQRYNNRILVKTVR